MRPEGSSVRRSPRRSRIVPVGMLLAAAVPAAIAQPAAVVTTERVRAELVAHAPQGVAPGKPVALGLKLRHAAQWHTYWKNPGDSGLPTTLAWKLPPGFGVGDIRWPVPAAIKVGPLMNYGYEGEVLLRADATVPAGFKAPTLDLRLEAEWLACREVCVPESGSFALSVPAGAATVVEAAAFVAAAAREPKTLPQAKANASFDAAGQALVVVAEGLPGAMQGRTLELFAENADVVAHAAPIAQSWQGGRWTARVKVSTQRSDSPATMTLLLVDPGTRAGWTIPAAVSGWPKPRPGPQQRSRRRRRQRRSPP